MPKTKKKKKRSKKTGVQRKGPAELSGFTGGEAGKGCYIGNEHSEWILGVEELPDDAASDYPEIAVDPCSSTLSAVNTHDCHRSFTISIRGEAALDILDGREEVLAPGVWRDSNGDHHPCITFVVIVPPRSIMDIAEVSRVPPDLSKFDVVSDIQKITPHPDPLVAPSPEHSIYSFPLEGDGPWLCTQSSGGEFTHYFAGTYHAVDFACEVGTPVLSIADGKVVEVRDGETAGGCHVTGLFKWNSVTVEMEGGIIAEYVHLKCGVLVKEGDKVSRGQTIALSGDVGFCPQPHLHLQLQIGTDPTAPTIPFAFQGADAPFVPVAGKCYNARGLRPSPRVEGAVPSPLDFVT